jgi:polyisoprenoid-binding protein YceI
MKNFVPEVSRFGLSVSLLFVLAACDADPAKGKVKASVGEAVTAPATAPAAGSAKYTFSNNDSKLQFVGAKVTGKQDGAFGTFNGTIDLVDGKPEQSRVTADIDTTSLSADNDKLSGHLKSPDFFDVAKYPKARFVSTAIVPTPGGPATHDVTGNLELRGITKSITFPATIKVGANALDIDAEFAINRKDFGIVYAGAPDDLIKDDVLIKLALRAGKATS